MAASEPVHGSDERPPGPTSHPESPDTQGVTARDYLFLGVLTVLSVMNFVDRQAIVSFGPYIMEDLSLSATQFGLLTGLVFIVFYAVMGLFAGALADMVNRPRLIAGALALWSVLTAVSGLARSFISIAIPRMLIGVGESVCTPTAMSMLSDRFPTSRLGMASAVYYMGVPIGVGVSLLLAGYLGERIGWRGVLFLLGGIGLIIALGLLLFMRDPPRRALSEGLGTRRPTFFEIYQTLFQALRRSPALVLTMIGGIAIHFLFGAAAFDPIWATEERGFQGADFQRMAGWISIPAGVAGNAIGGFGSDWWQ